MSADRARLVEDIGFMVAILVGLLYGIAETLARVGLCPISGRCTELHPSFPWGLAIVMGALVLPKTLGRSTAGKVWEGVVGRLPFRVKEKQPDDPPGPVETPPGIGGA